MWGAGALSTAVQEIVTTASAVYHAVFMYGEKTGKRSVKFIAQVSPRAATTRTAAKAVPIAESPICASNWWSCGSVDQNHSMVKQNHKKLRPRESEE